LLGKIKSSNKKLISKEQIISEIKSQNPEVLITMGAGDIGLEVVKIKKEMSYAG